MSIISIEDLNTTVNHEPRILDLRIAEALEFKQPRMIRKLISRYEPELESLGTCSTVERVVRGNVAKEYYLNKKQALFICTKSETEKATEVTIQMVEVFDSYLKGELQPTTITPAMQNAIQQIVKLRAGESKKNIMYFWSRFNNHFKLGSYKQLPASLFEEAIEYLKQIPVKEQMALPLPEVDPKEELTAYLKLADLLEEMHCINTARQGAWGLSFRLVDIMEGIVTERWRKLGKTAFPEAQELLESENAKNLISSYSKIDIH